MSSEAAERPTPQGSESTRTRTNRVVCTACRQSKVKCLGTENEACSRCTRLGLDCYRDSNFKRVSKSRKIAELERQVQLLASAFNASPQQAQAQLPQTSLSQQSPLPLASSYTNPIPRSTIYSPATTQNGTLNRAISKTPQYPLPNYTSNDGGSVLSLFHAVEDARPGATLGRSIQSAYVTGKEIDELFQIFFEHFHPALPFLNPSKSPDEYYESGSILFWLIISVASRRYSNDMLLFPVLSEWIPKMMWEIIAAPPYTIQLVQALVLHCMWPFPTASTWNDTVLTVSSIAVSAAMQLGLHRPLNATDFLRRKANADESDYQARVATWAAVNIASQSTESMFGVLPTTPFDRSIEAARRSGNMYTLPDPLRFKLVIFSYCNRISNLVVRDLTDNGDPFSPTTQPSNPTLSWVDELVGFEEKIIRWQAKYNQQLTLHDQIYISTAEVYTNSMYFFDSTPTPTRKSNILKAYTSVTRYLNLLISASTSHNYLQYAPTYPLRMFFVSLCLLVKVLRSSYATDVDFEAGKKLCNDAILASRKASLATNDTPGKVAKMMAQVWHSCDTEALREPPMLMVKSRLGASILYDFVWTWRQEFGGQPDAYPKSHIELSPSLNEDIFLPTDGVFDDASMVNLDFLNDPDWMDSITNSVLSS